MTTRSFAAFIGCTFVIGLATACTVVSGVDDYELRTSTSPASPAPAPDAATPETGLPLPFFPTADSGTSSGSPPPAAGTCGAEGTWSACAVDATATTCAAQCAQQGWSCVESCCESDILGDFPAKVGMVYALASECSLKAITSAATFGTCAEPIVLPAGITNVRCCCK